MAACLATSPEKLGYIAEKRPSRRVHALVRTLVLRRRCLFATQVGGPVTSLMQSCLCFSPLSVGYLLSSYSVCPHMGLCIWLVCTSEAGFHWFLDARAQQIQCWSCWLDELLGQDERAATGQVLMCFSLILTHARIRIQFSLVFLQQSC